MSAWSDSEPARLPFRPRMVEPAPTAGPMGRDELNDLTTLLYRAKGECFRRGMGAELVSACLGLVLAMLSTVQDEPRGPVTRITL